MPVVSVRIPQLGEGLQEARLIEFLKKPGEIVKRDEYIYVMETDKATTEVESPYEGEVVEWLVEPDTVLPIGAEIGKMTVAEGTREMSSNHHGTPQTATPRSGTAGTGREPPHLGAISIPEDGAHPAESTPNEMTATLGRASDSSRVGLAHRQPIRGANNTRIPPRTRRYLKDHKLLEIARHIPAAGTKLMPEDVDAFVKGGGPERVAAEIAAAKAAADQFDESILPSAQQTLNYRMARGAQVALPAVLVTDLDWSNLRYLRDQLRDAGGPTAFAMLLWCIADAMKEFPAFRSSLSSDGKTLRTYHHVNLGVAVSLPGDLLKTAVVRKADSLSKDEFFATLVDRVQAARDGNDQINAATTVSVSNVGGSRMRSGIPVVVTPAVATIAIGAVRDEPVRGANGQVQFRPTVTLTMSFDHRLMNGVGAANFLNGISQRVVHFVP